MADPEHLAILKKGKHAWNDWRDTTRRPVLENPTREQVGQLVDHLLSDPPPHRPDLSGADLSGLDLRGFNL